MYLKLLLLLLLLLTLLVEAEREETGPVVPTQPFLLLVMECPLIRYLFIYGFFLLVDWVVGAVSWFVVFLWTPQSSSLPILEWFLEEDGTNPTATLPRNKCTRPIERHVII